MIVCVTGSDKAMESGWLRLCYGRNSAAWS